MQIAVPIDAMGPMIWGVARKIAPFVSSFGVSKKTRLLLCHYQLVNPDLVPDRSEGTLPSGHLLERSPQQLGVSEVEILRQRPPSPPPPPTHTIGTRNAFWGRHATIHGPAGPLFGAGRGQGKGRHRRRIIRREEFSNVRLGS